MHTKMEIKPYWTHRNTREIRCSQEIQAMKQWHRLDKHTDRQGNVHTADCQVKPAICQETLVNKLSEIWRIIVHLTCYLIVLVVQSLLK